MANSAASTRLLGALAGVACAWLATPTIAESTPRYHVVSVQPLADKATQFDHLSADPLNRRWFIGNRSSGLTAVGIDTGIVSTVPETTNTAGAAIADDIGLGFADRGRDHDVAVFDLASLTIKGHIAMATELDGVFYDPATKMGYTNNADAGSITFFDPVTLTVGKTVELGTKKPEFSDVDGKGRAFIALQDKNAIAVVDTRAQALAATWPVDCEGPSGLAYEPVSQRIFVACRGTDPQLAVVDAQSGKTVARLPIGKGADSVAFDAARKVVLVPNGGSGDVRVFKQDSADTYHLVETVFTRIGARTLAHDAKTGKAVTVAAEATLPSPEAGAKPMRPVAVPRSLQLLTLDWGPVD